MAIDYNNMTPEDVIASYVGPTWCFPAVKSDTNYLTDPDDDSKPIVSSAISLTAAGQAVKVEMWNGKVVVIPAGALQAGVRYKLHIVKVWSTGTGTVDVLIWQGEGLRNFEPTSY